MRLSLLIPALFFIYFNTSAAPTYQSKDNQTGNWEDNSTWNSGVNLNNGKINIYGRVTRNGNLNIGNDLYIYDTLWISGDLTIEAGSQLFINDNAVLIIDGDLNGTSFWLLGNHNVDVSNIGKVVVMGDVNLNQILGTGSANIDNQDTFYVYGDVNTDGGASFDGSYGDEADLAEDEDLYDLVNGGTLPVTFLFVKAKAIEKSVDIIWATATEKNNDYFTIQRSSDGDEFVDLGSIDGAGNSLSIRDYRYTDNNPLPETAYYRIKQTDFDGQLSFSKIIRCDVVQKLIPNNEFTVYPNPSHGKINLDIHALNDNGIRCIIYNDQGTIVFSSSIYNQLLNPIDLEHFPRGVYLIEIRTNNSLSRKRILLN